MGFIDNIRNSLGDEWLPLIYRDRIRTQRTRSITLEILPRENAAFIQYTLLGIELKVGKKRFACPDLSTARYLRVFARFGAKEFAIPYDITKISTAADELETSWHSAILRLEEGFAGRPAANLARGRSRLVKTIRDEIAKIGSGEAMPLFDRETKRRKFGH